jgi:tetratricopeptide (TPR) repeat protein
VGYTALSAIQGRSLDDYIQEAQVYFDAKDIEQAIATMERAVKEHPKSSVAYAKLGDYISETGKRWVDILVVLPRALAMWDTAIALDPENLDARYNRGSWGVYVPQSLGQLEKAINDLEYVVAALDTSVDPAAKERFISALSDLAGGYRKHWEFDKAKAIYARIIDLAPDTKDALYAHTLIEDIIRFQNWLYERDRQKVPDSPEIIELRAFVDKHQRDVEKMFALGNAYLEANKDEEAARIFEKAVAADPGNIKAYKMLAFALKRIYDRGYDPWVSMDHNYLVDAVYKILSVLDKAISIAPDDMELRLMRGQDGITVFFFPGRHAQAIEDLQMIIDSNASDAIKSAARYELGRAHEKEAMISWLKMMSEAPDTPVVDSIREAMHAAVPQVDLSKYARPVVIIDFIMGFRDERAPQTAVWVETKEGTFVKSIYVSGFTGYARAKNILPQWRASSDFFDVDAVTGASIDMGHHVFAWDLKNALGEKVKSGEYKIKIEVTFWPSMQYQCVEALITAGKKEDLIVVKEGNLIPYLKVHYLP